MCLYLCGIVSHCQYHIVNTSLFICHKRILTPFPLSLCSHSTHFMHGFSTDMLPRTGPIDHLRSHCVIDTWALASRAVEAEAWGPSCAHQGADHALPGVAGRMVPGGRAGLRYPGARETEGVIFPHTITLFCGYISTPLCVLCLSILQVGLIARTSLFLVWAAGFKTCGTFVVPSIMTNEALYYPLEVRSRAWVGRSLFSPAQWQHKVCAVWCMLGLTFIPPAPSRMHLMVANIICVCIIQSSRSIFSGGRRWLDL